jgi:hypothetical protein
MSYVAIAAIFLGSLAVSLLVGIVVGAAQAARAVRNSPVLRTPARDSLDAVDEDFV